MDKLMIVLEELGQILKDECGIEIVIKNIEDEQRSVKGYFIENKDANEEISLIPEYNFDNYVEGYGSLMANKAAYEVANAPGQLYNPLFIYGETGVGKTHLLHAIGNYIKDEDPSSKVLYVTSEGFTNEVIEAIRLGKNSPAAVQRLRNKYRDVDALIIDNIQFIIGKYSTEKEFFNTFEHLILDKKQIIISSDKAPQDLFTIDDRYRFYFNWGLTVEIQKPDDETKVEILKAKREQRRYHISDAVIEYVVEKLNTDIRELEGALNRLDAYYRLGGEQEITVDRAREILADLMFIEFSDKESVDGKQKNNTKSKGRGRK